MCWAVNLHATVDHNVFPVPSELSSLQNIVISKSLYGRNVPFSLEILLKTQWWDLFFLQFYKSWGLHVAVQLVHRALVLSIIFTSLWGRMCGFSIIQVRWVSLQIPELEPGGQSSFSGPQWQVSSSTHLLAINLIHVRLRSLNETAFALYCANDIGAMHPRKVVEAHPLWGLG